MALIRVLCSTRNNITVIRNNETQWGNYVLIGKGMSDKIV